MWLKLTWKLDSKTHSILIQTGAWKLKKMQKMRHAMQTNTQMPSSSPPFIATGQHPKPITDNKLSHSAQITKKSVC